jgi:hypothetical protein
MIEGTIIAMGGQEWTVPPLSLAQLREFLPKVQQLSGLAAGDMGVAQLGMLVEIVTAAMQRNYPDLTPDQVENFLDLGNALPVLTAILGSVRIPAPEPLPVGDTPPLPPVVPLPAHAGVEPYESTTQWPHLPGASS